MCLYVLCVVYLDLVTWIKQTESSVFCAPPSAPPCQTRPQPVSAMLSPTYLVLLQYYQPNRGPTRISKWLKIWKKMCFPVFMYCNIYNVRITHSSRPRYVLDNVDIILPGEKVWLRLQSLPRWKTTCQSVECQQKCPQSASGRNLWRVS